MVWLFTNAAGELIQDELGALMSGSTAGSCCCADPSTCPDEVTVLVTVPANCNGLAALLGTCVDHGGCHRVRCDGYGQEACVANFEDLAGSYLLSLTSPPATPGDAETYGDSGLPFFRNYCANPSGGISAPFGVSVLIDPCPAVYEVDKNYAINCVMSYTPGGQIICQWAKSQFVAAGNNFPASLALNFSNSHPNMLVQYGEQIIGGTFCQIDTSNILALPTATLLI